MTNPMKLLFNTKTEFTGITSAYIPLNGTVDVTVNWGDGVEESFTSAILAQHEYAERGEYEVTITGTLTHFGGNPGVSAFLMKRYLSSLYKVLDFGDIGLESLKEAFAYTTNISQLPNNIPSTVISLENAFSGNDTFNLDISTWDVSNVINMNNIFIGAMGFGRDLSNWDISGITDGNRINFSSYSITTPWKISIEIRTKMLKAWSKLPNINSGIMIYIGGFYRDGIESINTLNNKGVKVYGELFSKVTFTVDGKDIKQFNVKSGYIGGDPPVLELSEQALRTDLTKIDELQYYKWYKDIGFTDEWVVDEDVPTNDITLYGKLELSSVEIHSIQDLHNMFKLLQNFPHERPYNSTSYTLMQDLDFLDDGSYDDTVPDGFADIADFKTTIQGSWQVGTDIHGVLNGNGFSIINMTVDTDVRPFIKTIYPTGKVCNLTFKDCTFSADPTGSIVSSCVCSNFGTIEKCKFVNSHIIGNKHSSSGLVGENFMDAIIYRCGIEASIDGVSTIGGVVAINRGTIRECYSKGHIQNGYEHTVGGIVGINKGGLIEDCYSTIQMGVSYLSGGGTKPEWMTDDYYSYFMGASIGGLVGHNIWGTIRRCHYRGKFIEDIYGGALVGTIGDAESIFWSSDYSGKQVSPDGENITIEEMNNVDFFKNNGWDIKSFY